MRRMNRTARTAVTAATLTLAFLASGCGSPSQPNAVEQAQQTKTQGVAELRANQPVEVMPYSPTIDTVNGWSATWGQEGKVSYVYMQRADGEFAGYYVLTGLPVNYCVSGSPTWEKAELYNGSGGGRREEQVPAPGLDGAYYGGCDASRYYGFDAVTGAYLEYTDGMVLTAVLSDAPLPLDQQPQAFGSTVEDVEKAGLG